MPKIIGNTTATTTPRSDWNQTDATKADYIKNKPDFVKGEGVHSVIGQGATTLADYGMAFGNGSVAGCKGYYIKSIDITNQKIYLTDTKVIPTISTVDNTDENFTTPAYNVGAQFSIINGTNYILCGTITTISNNTVTYEGDLGFTEIYEDTAIDGHTFSVPSQPEIGIVSFAVMSISLGRDNKSSVNCGFVVGRDNVLAGSYGAITGRSNIAAYGATADGVSNNALGQFSHASGTKNTVTKNGWAGFTHGANNEIDANYGVGLGRGLKVQSGNQTVLGRYNIPDAENNYLEIIGNGTSDTNRSNAYTVDKNGNLRIKGKAYVGGADKDSADIKELATVEALEQFVTKDYIEKQLSIRPSLMKCQRDDNLYSDKRASYTVTTAEEDGIVYANIEIINNSAVLLMDYYGKNNSVEFPIKNGEIYFKILMRTNQQVSPIIYVYRSYDEEGNLLSGNPYGQGELKGTGEWEEVIVKVSNLPTGAVKAAQIHLRFAGGKKGSDYFDAEGNLIGEPYFNIAGWAAFTDLALAEAYDFKSELLGLGSLNMEDVYIATITKADADLSNVDNVIFKAKVEDSGFKSGIPTIGRSNYCTYIVDEETNYLTDQLDRAFADGHNVVYIEPGYYDVKSNNHNYTLPDGNFTIIGLGRVNVQNISFVEPVVSAKKQWIYIFENIAFNGYKASYIEQEQDGDMLILSHFSEFYNCVIAYPSSFDLVNSTFRNCELTFNDISMEDFYNTPIESVWYEGCDFYIDNSAIIGFTVIYGCKIRLRNMTYGAIPSDTIQFKTSDGTSINNTTFYIGNPNCTAISNYDILVSECNFPYYAFTSDTVTIDETSCFINPATTTT